VSQVLHDSDALATADGTAVQWWITPHCLTASPPPSSILSKILICQSLNLHSGRGSGNHYVPRFSTTIVQTSLQTVQSTIMIHVLTFRGQKSPESEEFWRTTVDSANACAESWRQHQHLVLNHFDDSDESLTRKTELH
jgi:hypothetical protein